MVKRIIEENTSQSYRYKDEIGMLVIEAFNNPQFYANEKTEEGPYTVERSLWFGIGKCVTVVFGDKEYFDYIGYSKYAGFYDVAGDKIYIMINPEERSVLEVIHTLQHELEHCIDYRRDNRHDVNGSTLEDDTRKMDKFRGYNVNVAQVEQIAKFYEGGRSYRDINNVMILLYFLWDVSEFNAYLTSSREEYEKIVSGIKETINELSSMSEYEMDINFWNEPQVKLLCVGSRRSGWRHCRSQFIKISQNKFNKFQELYKRRNSSQVMYDRGKVENIAEGVIRRYLNRMIIK